MSSSDSDTDEDERRRLAESVIGVAFGADEQQKAQPTSKLKKKSIRNQFEEEEKYNNVLQTTPELRNFVAKKLDAFLNSEIIEKVYKSKNKSKNQHSGEDEGIKLMLESKSTLGDNILEKPKLKKRRRVPSSSDDDSDSMERFRSAVVTSDFIKAQDFTSYRSNDPSLAKIEIAEKGNSSKRKKKKKKKKTEDGTVTNEDKEQ